MKIILDTNFVVYCAKNKIDYFEGLSNLLNEDYEIVVPKQVIDELTKLRDDKFKKVSGKDKTACSLALKLLEHYKVKFVEVSGKTVDEGLIILSKEDKKNIVCTLDREMRHELPRVILFNKNKQLIVTR
jgi:rRNA-processing protein FCF1